MLDGRVDAFARHSISGWAAETDRSDARVDIVVLVDGHIQGHARADLPRPDLAELGTLGDGRHGFAYRFDPPLSPLRSYKVSVCHQVTGQPLRLGAFTIADETSHAAERIQPIMITTSGQPGFANLMRSLAGDPAIVAADSHGYGIKLMAYYAHALEVLVTPSGSSPAPRVGDEGTYVLAPNPFHAPDYEQIFPEPRQLYAFFQKRAAAPICAAFKTVVTDFYQMLAMRQGRHAAAYFAEQSDLFDVARSFARLAFSDMREIMLLQDPRDAYCGYRALWSVSPAQAMATLRRVRDRTIQLRAENRHDIWFLRTEDLRLRPQETLASISTFLSLDHVIAAAPETAQSALAATDDNPSIPRIGCWKTELESDEIAMFEQEFGEYLRLFGYEPASEIAA